MAIKLRHTPPVDDHEQQIVAAVERAAKELEKAVGLCHARSMARTANGSPLKARYKDTSRSLEAVLDMMRSIRGFGPLPQESNDADAKR